VAVHQLTLIELNETFAICKLSSAAPIPTWASASPFFSVTRTNDELSIVCRQEAVPPGVLCERSWRCLRVAGTIPFSVAGILASLTAPLTEAGIPIFAVSTFDTDYVLVKEMNLSIAVTFLRQSGHTVHRANEIF
jgi:hypothetical protein